MAPTVISRVAVVALTLAAVRLDAQVYTYVQTSSGSNQIALGYPVPTPVNSTTPVQGFRAYDSLLTRMDDLQLAKPFISKTQLGSTYRSRPIYAYTMSDADDVQNDGSPEAGSLFESTIHAREWGATETAANLWEFLANGYGTDPIATYLVDNSRIVYIPVLNVDGLLQTQRFYNQTYSAAEYDGRDRRKNMHNADELLTTSSDNQLGVDCNRNCPVGWGGSGSSSSTTAETYKGTAASSEPEIQALESVMSLFTASSQLRYYCDFHSAIPAYYISYNGVSAHDTVCSSLTDKMMLCAAARNGHPGGYAKYTVNPGGQEGATDEYFGYTFNIISHTTEVRIPWTVSSPNDFILPDAEVAATKDENLYPQLLAFYVASGPPTLQRMVVWKDANNSNDIDAGEVVYDASWTPTPGSTATARTLTVANSANLSPTADYRVWLTFNKPMRWDSGAGTPGNWPGQSVAIQPTVSTSVVTTTGGNQAVSIAAIGNGWLSTPSTSTTPGYWKYSYDSWEGRMRFSTLSPAPAPNQAIVMAVTATDFYGSSLDARPQTVTTWSNGWTGYENDTGSGIVGGIDKTRTLAIGTATHVEGYLTY